MRRPDAPPLSLYQAPIRGTPHEAPRLLPPQRAKARADEAVLSLREQQWESVRPAHRVMVTVLNAVLNAVRADRASFVPATDVPLFREAVVELISSRLGVAVTPANILIVSCEGNHLLQTVVAWQVCPTLFTPPPPPRPDQGAMQAVCAKCSRQMCRAVVLFLVAECAQTTPMIAPLPGDPNKIFFSLTGPSHFSSRESPTQPNPTPPAPLQPLKRLNTLWGHIPPGNSPRVPAPALCLCQASPPRLSLRGHIFTAAPRCSSTHPGR